MASAKLSAEMEQVVVTGTRTAVLLTESPVKVDVLDSQAIQSTHAHNASEILQQLNGIQLQKITGKEGLGAMIQGVAADKVLVLIDGDPVSASTGSTTDLTQIGLAGVERIEVVKGPVSVLYGSAAIGGVINIITAQPTLGFHGNIMTDVGSYFEHNVKQASDKWGKARLNSRLSYATEKWQWQGDFNLEQNEGFMAGTDAWSQPGPDGHHYSANLSARYSPNAEQYHQLQLGIYQQQSHTRYLNAAKPGETDPESLKQHKQDDALRHTAKYRGQFENNTSLLQWFATAERYENESMPARANDRRSVSDFIHLGTQLDQTFDWQILTMGLDAKTQSLSQRLTKPNEVIQEIEPVRFDTLEGYIQTDFEWLGMQILPGFRWHFDSDFGHDLTPKINGRYDLLRDSEKQLFLRAGIGRGYRVPNLKERYYLFDHSQLGYLLKGNAELNPERSLSYQLGIQFEWFEKLNVDVQFFYNDLTELISIGLLAEESEAGLDVYQYQNIAKAKTQGIEINTAFQLTDTFQAQLGYSYLDAQDLQKKRELPDRARHQVKVQLKQGFWVGSEAIAAYRFRSKTYQYDTEDRKFATPAYGIVDVKFNQAIGENLRVYLGVENAFDERKDFGNTQDIRPDTGRYGYLGIQYQW